MDARPFDETIKAQSDETLLRLWQAELARVGGDLKLATRTPLEARRRLVEKYQSAVSERIPSDGVQWDDRMDYLCAGNEALLEAIDTCDPARSFKTFAKKVIGNAIADWKAQNETGAAYRPKGSDNAFRYRGVRPGARAMMLASEEASNYPPLPDWSLDYEFENDEGDDNADNAHELHASGLTFDRESHAQRIQLDHLLTALDPRERDIIEKRYLISKSRGMRPADRRLHQPRCTPG